MHKMKSLRYAKRLVGFDSTSSLSNRLVSKYLEMKLTKHGFVVEKVEYLDEKRVPKVNLIAKKGGGRGGLAYFSHGCCAGKTLVYQQVWAFRTSHCTTKTLWPREL